MSAPNDPLSTPPPPTPPPAPPAPPVPPAPSAPVSYAPPVYIPPPAPPKKKKTWLIVLIVIASLALLFVVGCSVLFYGLYSFGKSHTAMTPEGALVTLHQHMTNSEDAAIYTESDPVYKAAVTEAQTHAMFDNIRTYLGNPINTQIEEKKTIPQSGDDIQELTVLTTFTKDTATEKIQFRKGADNQYHLLLYGINTNNTR